MLKRSFVVFAILVKNEESFSREKVFRHYFLLSPCSVLAPENSSPRRCSHRPRSDLEFTAETSEFSTLLQVCSVLQCQAIWLESFLCNMVEIQVLKKNCGFRWVWGSHLCLHLDCNSFLLTRCIHTLKFFPDTIEVDSAIFKKIAKSIELFFFSFALSSMLNFGGVVAFSTTEPRFFAEMFEFSDRQECQCYNNSRKIILGKNLVTLSL